MKTHYTKEYIESTTGMTFEEFLNVVKKYSDVQNLQFEILNSNIIAGQAVEIALSEITQYNSFYEDIEPTAGQDESNAQSHALDALPETDQPAQTLIEQVIQSQPDATISANSQAHASHHVFETTSSVAFERPIADSAALSQRLNMVFQSNDVLGSTDISYSSPLISAQASSPATIIADVLNIEPSARDDLFFGNQDTSISGNLLTDNGSGADYDIDGSISNVIAGTFTTDQGGIVIIQDNGDFTYTPVSGYDGVDRFSYDIQDNDGATDTADVTFALTVGDTATIIDFSTATITDYGVSQNISDLHFVEDSGATFQLAGNTWKDIALPYTITADTVLEFDFMSTSIGEIHGIGFDTDDGISAGYTFKLYGTQNWGLSDFNTYAGNEGEWVHYTINVGDFYTGNFDRLFFTNDDDVNANASSIFSNITIYDPGTAASETVTGTSSSQSLYGNGGDDVIYGLDGDDVLYGGSGIDFLYGGDDADTFIFDDLSAIDQVQDFNIAEGDALDISALLSGYDPITDAINDYVQFTSNGDDTFIAVDADGGGDNFVQIATLHGISDLAVESDLETSGHLITI